MMATSYNYLRRNPDTGDWENGTPTPDGYMNWSPVTLPQGAVPQYTDGGYAQWTDQSGTQIGEDGRGNLVQTTTDKNGNQTSVTPMGSITGPQAQAQLAAYGVGTADPAWASLFSQFGVQPGADVNQFQSAVSTLRASQNQGGGGFMDSLASGISGVGNSIGTSLEPVITAVANPYTLAAIAGAAITGGASLGELGTSLGAEAAGGYGAGTGMLDAGSALANAAAVAPLSYTPPPDVVPTVDPGVVAPPEVIPPSATLPADGASAGASGANDLFPPGMSPTGTPGATSVTDSAINAVQNYIDSLSPSKIATSAAQNAAVQAISTGNVDPAKIGEGVLVGGLTGALGAAGAGAAGAEGLGPLAAQNVTTPLASAAVSTALGGSPVGGLVAAGTGAGNNALDSAIPAAALPLLNAGITSQINGTKLGVNLPASIIQTIDPLVSQAASNLWNGTQTPAPVEAVTPTPTVPIVPVVGTEVPPSSGSSSSSAGISTSSPTLEDITPFSIPGYSSNTGLVPGSSVLDSNYVPTGVSTQPVNGSPGSFSAIPGVNTLYGMYPASAVDGVIRGMLNSGDSNAEIISAIGAGKVQETLSAAPNPSDVLRISNIPADAATSSDKPVGSIMGTGTPDPNASKSAMFGGSTGPNIDPFSIIGYDAPPSIPLQVTMPPLNNPTSAASSVTAPTATTAPTEPKVTSGTPYKDAGNNTITPVTLYAVDGGVTNYNEVQTPSGSVSYELASTPDSSSSNTSSDSTPVITTKSAGDLGGSTSSSGLVAPVSLPGAGGNNASSVYGLIGGAGENGTGDGTGGGGSSSAASVPLSPSYFPKIVPSGGSGSFSLPNYSAPIQTPQVMIPPSSSSSSGVTDSGVSGLIPSGVSAETAQSGVGKPYTMNSTTNLSSPKLAELHALMIKLGMDSSMYVPKQITPTTPQELSWTRNTLGGLS